MSTDQNVADEEKSVARQVARARAYAERKGWTVAEEHIDIDDGISGADFVRREGYLRLMNALKPRAPFQVLVMMEQSRLGRSLDEVPYALRRITEAGVRVLFYLTDTEVKRDTAVDRFQSSVMAFVDEMHREQSRQRTRDAMRRRAELGHVAGGMVYGYRNREVRVGDKRSHVLREIDPEQAEVVRRIFREIARGDGFTRIAKRLNAERVPSPRPRRRTGPRRRAGRPWSGGSARSGRRSTATCGRSATGSTWTRCAASCTRRRPRPSRSRGSSRPSPADRRSTGRALSAGWRIGGASCAGARRWPGRSCGSS